MKARKMARAMGMNTTRAHDRADHDDGADDGHREDDQGSLPERYGGWSRHDWPLDVAGRGAGPRAERGGRLFDLTQASRVPLHGRARSP